ncbi:MAG TPA: heavy-metal-associated domain-containing protein [Candidatus Anaerostipes avistercoris]|uniref:Heavy-metal-associated domain-containing protein n=1 Tax=Candidatus Anaerostipes avistercoris TaxID=2838462 RepID=A0A9D2T9H8_9FIRM|nr:heavy-metal-associated domain-containing protein [Candidatus Anaerostipes avistercoris]
MVDTIIVIIVVLLMVLAAKQAVKHFRGEGSCCGGGSGASKVKIKEKQLSGPVIGKKTMAIEGMHCEHCVQNVMGALNSIQGVSAKVFLDENKAVVSYETEVSENTLRNAVENAGYKVRSII